MLEVPTDVPTGHLADPGIFDFANLPLLSYGGPATLKTLDLNPARRFNAGLDTRGAMNGRR
jgi:hypothetical protein